MDGKWCPRCAQHKRLAEFYRCSARADGRQRYCKKCCNEHMKISQRARKYGLKQNEVELLLEIPECQNAACRRRFESESEMCFDHCHVGGEWRGVLCNRCNAAASGPASEAVGRLRGLAEYLARWLEQNEQSGQGNPGKLRGRASELRSVLVARA